MITTPVERRFTLPYDRVEDFLPVARLSGADVWVRITTPVKPAVGAKVGIKLDIGILGRPMELVAEVQTEEQTGFRAKVIEAALADMIVLTHILGGDPSPLTQAVARPGPRPQPDSKPPDLPTPAALAGGTPAPSSTPATPARSAPMKTQKLHRLPELEPQQHQADDFTDLLVRDTVQIVSDRVLGIDLGTSNSCVALSHQGHLSIFADRDGRETTPSVVGFGNHGHVIVGQEAVDQMPDNPERTIYGSKRLIGRAFSSEAVQTIIHKVPYKIVPDGNNTAAIEVEGAPVSMAEVGSHVLRHLKSVAERTAGQELQRAVITVPAYYNDNQRHAVKHAGSLAGLHVERIIDEPTAAAIAFGVAEEGRDRKILIYDFGGGTFDVSVMQITGNHLFKTLATAGDNFLGGADIDARIVDYVIQTYEEGYGHNIWSTHPGIRARFIQAAEEAKKKLSDEVMARIEVENVPLTTSGTTNVLVNLARPRLEALIESLVTRTLYLADQAMRQAGLTNRDLDAVVLVGGQTQMPYVRQRLQKHFGQLVRHDIDPAKAVAMGAALLAQSVEQGLPAVSLEATLPITIGLASSSNPVFKPFIKKNTPLPYRAAFPVTVSKKDWMSFKHDVFQGESPQLEENEYLGTIEVNTLEPGPQDPVPLTFEFELTKECLLNIFVSNQATNSRDEVMLAVKEESPSLAALKLQQGEGGG